MKIVERLIDQRGLDHIDAVLDYNWVNFNGEHKYNDNVINNTIN